MNALPLPAATMLLLMLSLPGAAQRRSSPSSVSVPSGVTTIRTEVRIQRVIVRVPRAPFSQTAFAPSRPLPPIQWTEKRTDHCVPIQNLAAVSVSRPNSVDLLLNGGKRLRARLADDCPALDFYSGLYLKPTSDGKLCASRDVIRSRSGGQCRIATFRALVPAR